MQNTEYDERMAAAAYSKQRCLRTLLLENTALLHCSHNSSRDKWMLCINTAACRRSIRCQSGSIFCSSSSGHH
jgi:hypothetical protein